jgi:UDP-2,3-diacylglucosamine pyrophosphatase LpxH
MKQANQREVEVVVISDVHLGTYGSQAAALENYLKSIKPKILVLNGDIIDIWQFSKDYWPSSHMKIVKRIFSFLSKKTTQVYFLPGNHDEMLRKFVGLQLGRLRIENKLVLDLNGEKTWIFHGDAFDVTMQHSRWLAKLGAVGYDLLILLNSGANRLLQTFGKPRISFAGRIKKSVKQAVSSINSFEQTVAQIAADQNYGTVICGHIHQPVIKTIKVGTQEIRYLNSGDWIENLTALEYNNGEWSLHHHPINDTAPEEAEPDPAVLFSGMKQDILSSGTSTELPL